MNQTGHTVLITGGASGIGLALAEQFLRYDNKVIVVGRNDSKLAEARERNRNLTTIRCDLNSEHELNTLVRRLYEEYPNLSVLINNAGVQYNYSFLEGDSAQITGRIADEVGINLVAPLQLTAGLLPLLSSQEQSAIVNVSSGLGLVPKQSAPVYCATKAGLHLFTKALRYQLETTRTKVFEILPPLVDTDMTRGRGYGKITAEALAREFWASYLQDRLEVAIGKVKLLRLLNRIVPSRAEALLKNS
ncbi:SDR family oxidoreductase [Paenibacillus sp. YPG26]|uniref:SDR family oxidoreductase n=1 Tax=Paenibacillus sp. YPG26 TaxID=2878915 RepID=UPI00203F1724|nr:SDR family oxidoreductase [Paenibacillus sp. YPG26]USB32320.1 SDR family oxidoreductase [Paenibacillus sp. YPG26]